MGNAHQDTLVLHKSTETLGGRWEIVAPLADGGMGHVYVGRHVRTGKQAAIKVLGRDDPEVLARFKLEASVAADVNHPGIVDVYDADVDEKSGRCFLAMELLHGRTLREAMDDPSSTPAYLLELLVLALEPLIAAHRKGYVHRDLKPENIFVLEDVTSQCRVKLLDFGIVGHDFQKGITQTGVAMGTPHYMSPEQATDAAQAQPSADVWSMGVLLYEALNGAPPFTGATAHAVVLHACTQEAIPLHTVQPEIAGELSELIMRCLSKEPETRPKDAAELHRALIRLRSSASIPADRTPSMRIPQRAAGAPSQIRDREIRRARQTSGTDVNNRAPRYNLIVGSCIAATTLLFASQIVNSLHTAVIATMELTGLALASVGGYLLLHERVRSQDAAPHVETASVPVPVVAIPSLPELPPLSRGPKDPLVNIELYVDLSSSLSRRVCEQLIAFQREYAEQVRLGIRFVPAESDGLAFALAEAVEEVHLQHNAIAAWTFVQTWCSLAKRVSELQLEQLAKSVGMHMTRFRHALFVRLHESSVRRRRAQWLSEGVSESLVIKLQGTLWEGDFTRQTLARALDDALQSAILERQRKSGVGLTQVAVPENAPRAMALRQFLVCFSEARDAPKAVRRTRAQARERAHKLRARALLPGADFTDLALRFGDGDVELGQVELASLPEAILLGVLTLAIGEISGVLEASDGYHVIQRLS